MIVISDHKKQTKNEKQVAKRSTGALDQIRIDRKIEEKIDRDLNDSFPASDPPGWTLGV